MERNEEQGALKGKFSSSTDEVVYTKLSFPAPASRTLSAICRIVRGKIRENLRRDVTKCEVTWYRWGPPTTPCAQERETCFLGLLPICSALLLTGPRDPPPTQPLRNFPAFASI